MLREWAEGGEYLKVSVFVHSVETPAERRVEALRLLAGEGYMHRLRWILRVHPDPAPIAEGLAARWMSDCESGRKGSGDRISDILQLFEFIPAGRLQELQKKVVDQINSRVDWSGNREEIWDEMRYLLPLPSLPLLGEAGGPVALELMRKRIETAYWRNVDSIEYLLSLKNVEPARIADALRDACQQIFEEMRLDEDIWFSPVMLVAIERIGAPESVDLLIWLSHRKELDNGTRMEAHLIAKKLAALLGLKKEISKPILPARKEIQLP